MWPVLYVADWTITLYGVLVVAGYTAGILWCLANVKNAEGTLAEFWALGYTLVFGALSGARLGYYLVEWRTIAENPSFLTAHWRTGWVFWTGFIGSMVLGKVFQIGYNRLYRPRRYLQIADYFGPALALGHTIGRVACFAEGCCHGTPTNLPWGVTFTSAASSVAPDLLGRALHPVQIYEALGSVIFFLLFAYYILPRIRAKQLTYGVSFLGYIVCYAVMRFFLEFLRGDDRGFLISGLLSPSQWISIGAVLCAGFRLYYQGIYERNPNRTIFLDSEIGVKA